MWRRLGSATMDRAVAGIFSDEAMSDPRSLVALTAKPSYCSRAMTGLGGTSAAPRGLTLAPGPDPQAEPSSPEPEASSTMGRSNTSVFLAPGLGSPEDSTCTCILELTIKPDVVPLFGIPPEPTETSPDLKTSAEKMGFDWLARAGAVRGWTESGWPTDMSNRGGIWLGVKGCWYAVADLLLCAAEA